VKSEKYTGDGRNWDKCEEGNKGKEKRRVKHRYERNRSLINFIGFS
jgi:hypothetical protein